MTMFTLVLSPYFLPRVKITCYFQTSFVCDYGAISGFKFRCFSPAQPWGGVKVLGDPESAAAVEKRCWPKSNSAHVASLWGPHSYASASPTAQPWFWMPGPGPEYLSPPPAEPWSFPRSPGPLSTSWTSWGLKDLSLIHPEHHSAGYPKALIRCYSEPWSMLAPS